MRYRELGASGLRASVVGLGTWAIGGSMWGGADERSSIRAICAAIDEGVNFLDTAPVYGFGLAETIVGKTVAHRRDDVILASKCGLIWHEEKGTFFFEYLQTVGDGGALKRRVYRCLRPHVIQAEVEWSLRRLRTEYIDLYQVHWPDPCTPMDDVLAAFGKLKDEGKIRAVGVSNMPLQAMRTLRGVDTDQESFSMLDRRIEDAGILRHCRDHGMAVIAYSTLAMGLLSGTMDENRIFKDGDHRKRDPRFSRENRARVNRMLQEFDPLAVRYGVSTGQLVIAWTFSQPGVTHVLCGARNAEQAMQNARAGRLKMAEEDLRLMDAIVKRHMMRGRRAS